MRELVEFWLFVAFIGMLLLLRFDAHRFGVAEYDDEARHGGWRGWLRRLSFYALGIALVLLVYAVYPQPITVLHLDLGTDRQQAMLYGLLYGLGATLVAFGFAWYRYRRFRLPGARAYPGAVINALATSFIDEALFRGVILGLLLHWGWPPALAIAFETILYGLATRLGAPGRSRAMLLIFLGAGAVGGWLVLETLGIGAAVIGHAILRFAIFLATGHAGSVHRPGWEPEELASWALPPQGWDIVSGADDAGAGPPAGYRLAPGPQAPGPWGPPMPYGPPPGYDPNAGYVPPGYGAPPGYGPPPGYDPNVGYGPPPGYDPSAAYAPPSGHAPPPGYDPSAAYAPPPGYDPNAGYAQPPEAWGPPPPPPEGEEVPPADPWGMSGGSDDAQQRD